MSGKRTKHLKTFNKKRIPGNHLVFFYYDYKTAHPFMCISNYNNYYYGHEMTTHPSLRQNGSIKSDYIRFRRNPNPTNKNKSYYHKSIKRIINTTNKKGKRLRMYKTWKISNTDLRRLKRLDKRKSPHIRQCIFAIPNGHSGHRLFKHK